MLAKKTTIHTSRTIMFKELEQVMDHGAERDDYFNLFADNVAGKKTRSNIDKTNKYLQQLYSFDRNDAAFRGFKYFWELAGGDQKAILALLFAVNRDYLLSESVEIIEKTQPGEKVSVEIFENNLDRYHPGRYTSKTKRSVAQNLASSWKKAGFIEGKIKNIRRIPKIGFLHVAFAMFLSYINGDRGEFVMQSLPIKALASTERKIRDMAFEAAKRDLLEYQYSGELTSISFNKLLKKLKIDAI